MCHGSRPFWDSTDVLSPHPKRPILPPRYLNLFLLSLLDMLYSFKTKKSLKEIEGRIFLTYVSVPREALTLFQHIDLRRLHIH